MLPTANPWLRQIWEDLKSLEGLEGGQGLKGVVSSRRFLCIFAEGNEAREALINFPLKLKSIRGDYWDTHPRINSNPSKQKV